MLLSVVKVGSAPSVLLVISVRHAFSSLAFSNTTESMLDMSIPDVREAASVFAVGALRPFRFVMIVVLGVLIVFSPPYVIVFDVN